jgi:ferredoxin-NADP reductase
MSHHIVRNNIPHKNIYLIFGCRKLCDGLYAQEMKELEKSIPSFKYIPTFSREDDNNTSVRRGYVHAVYEEICKAEFQPSDEGITVPGPAYFYLCGWKNMIDEARQRILALGYDKKAIHLELYG